MNNVEWRDVVGFEGLYKVSSDGDVVSLVGWDGRKYIRREKAIKPTTSTTGYLKVELKKCGKKKSMKLHRVIAMAFIPNPNEYTIINHIDGDPLNNRIDNLEWCTQAHNVQHAYDNGLNSRKKMSKDEIIREYTLCEGETMASIAKRHGVTKGGVHALLRRYGIRGKPRKSAYGICLEELKRYFEDGLSNADIAQIYGCRNDLIARRRYQYKKGEI